MDKYSIIFSDIDGTLLNSSHTVPKKTAAIIRTLCGRGALFVPVSARMPSAIYPITNAIGISTPVIAYGGALILGGDKKPLLSKEIPSKTAGEVVNFIDAEYPDVSVCLYGFDDWITRDIKDPRVAEEIEITGVIPTETPFREYLSQGAVHKIFCVGNKKRTDGLTQALNKNFEDICACKSDDTYIEVMAKAASKGAAASQYAGLLGIPKERTIAFGDHYNDSEMLKAAGLSVAMGNAVDELKQIADTVAPTNDQEGMYHILKKLADDGLL